MFWGAFFCFPRPLHIQRQRTRLRNFNSGPANVAIAGSNYNLHASNDSQTSKGKGKRGEALIGGGGAGGTLIGGIAGGGKSAAISALVCASSRNRVSAGSDRSFGSMTGAIIGSAEPSRTVPRLFG